MPGPGLIDSIIAYAADSIATLARGVASGQISAAQFEREMRIELARGWATSFTAGLGREPTRAEQKWLEREYNKHDRFVRAFRKDIEAGNLSEAQILNRAGMYADRLRGLYEAGGAAAHGLKLPFVPGSGSTKCLTNCRCSLDYETGEDGKEVATWIYDPSVEAHCDDCIALNGLPHTEWQQAIGA